MLLGGAVGVWTAASVTPVSAVDAVTATKDEDIHHHLRGEEKEGGSDGNGNDNGEVSVILSCLLAGWYSYSTNAE